jgi:bis(5'-nucleosidyl)-tetraphosphatase
MEGVTREICSRASGTVLYRTDGDELLFLLLENALHGTWGFPKGRLEQGEDIEEGARRECLEETGLKIGAFHPGFLKRIEYVYLDPVTGVSIRKKVHYFLSRLESGTVHRSPEHRSSIWETRLKARDRLQFDNLREILDCAYSVTAAGSGLDLGDTAIAKDLLNACSKPDEMWRRHCFKVAEVARKIAVEMCRTCPELPVDPVTVEAGALLHDIGRCRDQGALHPRRGMELLMEKGLGHLAKPCISHWLKGRKRSELEGDPCFTTSRLESLFRHFDLDTMTLSEKIISVADSLVQHDRLVRLEERYREARERYGASKWMADNERITAVFIKDIEDHLEGSLYALLQI